MSYITDRIKKNLEKDPAYRAAYEEEVQLLEQTRERRKAVMRHLANLRKGHHVTQEQLAQKLQVSQERVSQIESGSETISLDSLLEIAAALGVKMVIVEDEDIVRHGLENMVVC